MSIRMLLMSALMVAPLALATSLMAAPESDSPETHRAANSSDLDRPAAPILVVIPKRDVLPPVGGINGRDDLDNPEPGEELPPEPEEEQPQSPPYFGEPVFGRIIWVLDRSGSMGGVDSGTAPIEMPDGSNAVNPNRLQIVKAETIRAINGLSDEDEFALVTFGAGPDVDYSEAMMKATPGNKQAGIAKVSSMIAYGGTPAYPALQRACTQYGADVTKFFFLSDGSPNVGGSAANCLADFPIWYMPLRDEGCSFICICIGPGGPAVQFMQALTNLVGGTYIQR